MGTTRTAKNAGSIHSVYVVAIEGYEYLLTNARTTAAAVTAWSGTDWSQALPGLFVDELTDEQSIHPDRPFQGGGKCFFRVVAQRGQDRFGIDTHRKYSGAETQLTQTLDRADTTMNVAATADFASSGHVHIGTECIAYTGKTATSLTGLGRAKYMPFKTTTDPIASFAQQHRVRVDPQSVLLQPVVSAQPRVWIGRWVGVYEHRVVGGVLDTLDEAELVYAGKIVDIHDDGNAIAVELKHVLDVVCETSIGRSLWSATVKEGIYLFSPQRFRMADSTNAWSTVHEADDLLVVPGAAANVNEISEGYYTVEELHGRLNAWWASERAATNIVGEYSIAIAPNPGTGERTKIYWELTGDPRFRFVMPNSVQRFFGFGQAVPYAVVAAHSYIDGLGPPGQVNHFVANQPPLRSIVDKFTNLGPAVNAGLRFEVEDERGVFYNQFNEMPDALKGGLLTDEGLEWGIFLFDDSILIRAAKVGNEIRRVGMPPVNYGARYNDDIEAYAVPWDDATPELRIRQILVVEAPIAALINLLFHSTGTAGHNHDTWDVLSFGLGLAIPGSLMGSPFEASVNALPGAGGRVVALIDKTTTLRDLIDGDMILRRAFLYWKNGTLRFGTWRVPVAGDAVATLDASNKATPSGTTDDHRMHSRETDEWWHPIVRIYYDRDITDLSTNDGFRSERTLEDSTAVDEGGSDRELLTIKVRNVFRSNAGIGADINDLIANYLATMPAFTSRPGRKLTRSISPRLYEQLAVGDIVLVTDDVARDPVTGVRGMEQLPAIIIRKFAAPGGKAAGSDSTTPPTGTVDLFLPLNINPERSGASYAPTADVDETYDEGDFSAGYNATTKTLRCYGYRYSDDGTLVAPALTDANWFPAGAKIRIVERDPADPSAPQSWDRGVASQSSDDIVHDGAELAGWDPTRKYRVHVDVYSEATTAQHEHAFQADEDDGLIEDVAPPYLYASWPSGTSQYKNNMNSTIGVELPADLTFVDGAGRDVGTDQAVARLGDYFIDYKSALSLPSLSNEVLENDEYEGGFLLLAMTPIYLSIEFLSASVWRELGLRPWLRSASGASVQLRASLCRQQPTGFSIQDIDRGSFVSAATWTTSNTNWEAGTRIEVDCRMKSLSGHAWLLLEGTYGCQTRGFSRVGEGPRLFENQWWIPS